MFFRIVPLLPRKVILAWWCKYDWSFFLCYIFGGPCSIRLVINIIRYFITEKRFKLLRKRWLMILFYSFLLEEGLDGKYFLQYEYLSWGRKQLTSMFYCLRKWENINFYCKRRVRPFLVVILSSLLLLFGPQT